MYPEGIDPNAMPRLFTALDLPPATAHELTAIQPAPAPNLRLVPPDQMHITLNFIGDADTDHIATALATVTAAPFQLDLRGVGHFQSASGAVTLWAGVELCAERLRLHAAVGAALAGVGFEPESRPYPPHVSLALRGRGHRAGIRGCVLRAARGVADYQGAGYAVRAVFERTRARGAGLPL